MKQDINNTQSTESRTLIFSQRKLSRIKPFRCPHFEFEDIIAEVDTVDMLTPRLDPTTHRSEFTKRLAYHIPMAFNPGVEQIPIQGNYDLFFAICGNPTELQRINCLGDWRSRCRKAVCLIDELWIREIGSYRHFLRILEKFDLVVLYYSQTVGPLSATIDAECMYMPPAVDAIRFCPYPNPPDRVVDVYSAGRRSEITHQALLESHAREGLFYLYDSIAADQVLNAAGHRALFANIVKRSRYFIVNPGLIDRPDIRGDQIEMGNRYFEGAASGTLMIGSRPNNGEFERLFNWPEPMIDLPWNSAAVAQVMRDLDKDPVRQEFIRRRNVEESLLHHDWIYRWQNILRAVGMELLPKANDRKARLHALAQMAASTPSKCNRAEECMSK